MKDAKVRDFGKTMSTLDTSPALEIALCNRKVGSRSVEVGRASRPLELLVQVLPSMLLNGERGLGS